MLMRYILHKCTQNTVSGVERDVEEAVTKRGSFHLKQEHSCFWNFSGGRNVL